MTNYSSVHQCKKRMISILTILVCMFCLTYCTSVTSESHLNQQKMASPYSMPVSAYLAMANNQTGSERQALLLMAAGRSIYEGQWRHGSDILQETGPVTGELADEKHVLLAKIDLIRNQPSQSIAQLAAVRHSAGLSSFLRAQYHDILASAYQANGSLIEAAVERMKLDSMLPATVEKVNNRRALWLCLTKLPQPDMDTLLAESRQNTILRGWVVLAEISRRNYSHPQDMLADLHRWHMHYPNHPAQAFLPANLDQSREHLFAQPKHMALLLPLTGPLAGPGMAVRDGFRDAYQASAHTQRSVRVYNTDQADVRKIYQRAVEEGADYIVGPLTKKDAAKVAAMPHPVPTILLNEAPNISDPLAFQFGLSPTQEAHQVAKRARKNGYSKALVIAPAGEWGTEVVHAFAQQWTAYRGQVVETWQYTPTDDLSAGVRQLLHASESAARVRPTARVAHGDNEYKRRHDFDVVILVAYPSKARQIMPLLRYYFAGDVPVYATSAVYSGTDNTAKDRDLDGIIFCDMPWVFTHKMGQEHHWTEQLNSYNRLYALGMDSFALSTHLNQLMLFPAIGINSQSGIIYMTKEHKLLRILVFGQFRQGIAQILGTQ